MNLYRKTSTLLLSSALLLLAGCHGVFDTHPYDVRAFGGKAHNASAIADIEAAYKEKDTLRVAVISDTHLWHSPTEDEVANINSRGDVDFVIHLGDLTDTGTQMEFRWVYNILKKLNPPYVALIGNHDFLGTGDQTYRTMYGPVNFSFIAGGIKFVCVDTNAMEYDHAAGVPDLGFLASEATARREEFSRTVVLMHAPPFGEMFDNNLTQPFRERLADFPGLLFCVYGHKHVHEALYLYDDDLLFYGVTSAEHRRYRLFTFTPDGYEEETIDVR